MLSSMTRSKQASEQVDNDETNKRKNTPMNLIKKLPKLKLPQPKTVFFVTLSVYALLFTLDIFYGKAHPATFFLYGFVLFVLYFVWQYDERQKIEQAFEDYKLNAELLKACGVLRKTLFDNEATRKNSSCGCTHGGHTELTPQNHDQSSKTSSPHTPKQSNC